MSTSGEGVRECACSGPIKDRPCALFVSGSVFLTRGLRRASQPFVAQDGVEILIAPGALEPDVFVEMRLTTQAQAFQQRHRGSVLDVDDGDDTVEIECRERPGEQCGDRFEILSAGRSCICFYLNPKLGVTSK